MLDHYREFYRSNTNNSNMPGKGQRKKGGNGGNRNGKGKGRKNGGGRATRGLRGITQSVALSVNNAFGDTAKPQTIVKGLDAFDSSHVPLPRAVGDYTVIRTTEVFSGTNKCNLYGPMKTQVGGGTTKGREAWSSICAVRSNALSSTELADGVGTNSNEKRTFSAMASGAWNNANVTPAAFTVKVMNPEALQTTSGIVYIGRAKQMLNPGGNTRSWGDFAQELVSYSTPELCAAGRLALRGVKVDAVPYDMNSLADFRPLDAGDNLNFTWSSDDIVYDGFAPIFVYNPNGVDLQIMICCEWRVRFDPSNPAYASHSYHQPSTLGYWDRVQRIGSALGNGVMDLAEKSAPQLMMSAAQAAAKNYGRTLGPALLM